MTPDRSTPETDPVGIATAITIQQVGSPKKIRLGRSHDSENGPSNPSQELDSARQYHGHNKDSSLQTSGTDATSALRSAMTSAQNFTDAPIKHSLHETDGYKHRQRDIVSPDKTTTREHQAFLHLAPIISEMNTEELLAAMKGKFVELDGGSTRVSKSHGDAAHVPKSWNYR